MEVAVDDVLFLTTKGTEITKFSDAFIFVSFVLSVVDSIVFAMVGLGRRAPPTYRQRREWSHRARENSRRNRISSHLGLRVKVGGPRRVSPTTLKSADRAGSTLPVALSRKDYFVMVKW